MPFARYARRSGVLAVIGGVIIVSALVYQAHQAHAPLRSANDVARQVGTHYGDPHPRIVRVDSTQTDNPPHDPMYYMTLAGHFHRGGLTARYLTFSALADKTYVWGVIGYDKPDTQVWQDDQLEPLPK